VWYSLCARQNQLSFDKTQVPHVRAEDLCSYFGVAASTGSAKAKVVLDHLRIRGHDPNWTLPSRLADHPFIWLVSVNGLTVDIRDMPEEVQKAAHRRGIIPFVPGKLSRT
jgi:hypothetical protein